MKRFLIISPYLVYPVTFGGQSRVHSIVRLLESCGVRMDFLLFNSPPKDKDLCNSMIRNLHPKSRVFIAEPDRSQYIDYFRHVMPHVVVPDAVLRFCSGQTQEVLHNILLDHNYDAIIFEHSYFGALIPFIRERTSARIILDLHNIEARYFESVWDKQEDFFEKMKLYLNWQRMQKYEEQTFPLYDHCFALSIKEMEMFQSIAPKVNVSFIPTGIDTETITQSEYQGKSVLFTGDMGYVPNIEGIKWFADNVWPRIRAISGRLLIAGRNPSPELVNTYAVDNKIVFLGFQEDLTPFIHESRVFIVPIFSGAGSRIKLLTGWASALPMVSTTFGAEGIYYENGSNIVLANEPDEFTEKILELYGDEEKARRIGQQGREWVYNNYDNQTLSRKMSFVIEHL